MDSSKIIVQKIRGTSVKSPERIKAVADRIKSYREKGFSVVVVVSAMGRLRMIY
jgi:aspartate kinase